jgi:hypothetical protein
MVSDFPSNFQKNKRIGIKGYGHATRVSALASQLLVLRPTPTVYIVSSAPQQIFSDCIALGALYRLAEIDPVIVQPIASVPFQSFRSRLTPTAFAAMKSIDRRV